MGSPDIPKGNVYSENDWNQVPMFPEYMEEPHKKWIGFVDPCEYALIPFLKINYFDGAPAEGSLFWLTCYSDQSRTVEITPEEANLSSFGTRWNVQGFAYVPYYNKQGTQIGIELTQVQRCAHIKTVTFMLLPQKRYEYWKSKSVTATMNSVFDRVISDLDRLNTIRNSFEALTDIRRLENYNASQS
jgi:hypothetical protein